ncbi:hypothetical protein B0H34DRAFT_673812 [Crassisporium funariophilum]|nr:hypothetical protein B0H34DRAFT_673812 [Crassisporium funariophilum]
MRDLHWWKPWDALRPFFLEAGYDLDNARAQGGYGCANTMIPPALESLGLHGDRSDYHSQFQPGSQSHYVAQVFAARDRKNRDVVIKVISKGNEGSSERKILQLLNSEPLRSDLANATVQVIEFLEYQDFCFAVMPFCDGSDERPFLTAFECLDFAERISEIVRAIVGSLLLPVSECGSDQLVTSIRESRCYS